MREIASADAAMLIGPDSEPFIKMLQERHKKVALFPAGVVLGLIGLCVTIGLALSGSAWWWVASACIAAGASIGGWFVRERDLERKTVQVDYEMDEHEQGLWTELRRGLMAIDACQRVWQRTAEGEVRDRKYHAGASSLVHRRVVSIRSGAPPYFKSNVNLVTLAVKGQTLYWTPRYIVIYQAGRVGLVRYRDLEVSADTTRFIEEDAVPGDARVVDTTWQYVNKSGGPDRRFSNNREIPVCLYGEATLRSSGGLHVELMLSRVDAADALAPAVAAIVQFRQTKQEQHTTGPAPTPEVIVFCCQSCGTRFRVDTHLEGKSAKCKACGASLIVPGPEAMRPQSGGVVQDR